MNLISIRAAVAAFEEWRVQLDDPVYCLEAEARAASVEQRVGIDGAAGTLSDRYISNLHAARGSGLVPGEHWSLDVDYVVSFDAALSLRDINVIWTFGQRTTDGPVLEVAGTTLSLADELAHTFADQLEEDPRAGELQLRSVGLPFALLVHRTPWRILRKLAPYVRPLIIIGPEVTAAEIAAQLMVFALRCPGLLVDEGDVLRALEHWASALVSVEDPHVISRAAEIVIRKWVRPNSSRSFRDYWRRTLRGIAKDEARRSSMPAPAPDASGADAVLSVDDTVRLTGVPRRTVYRWLRIAGSSPDVVVSTSVMTTPNGLTLRRKRRRYEVSGPTVAFMAARFDERNLRRALVAAVARERGITVRGARALVTRRLAASATLEAVGRELLRRPSEPP